MKMHTVVHYVADIPGATPEEMKMAEALMRDPDYVEAIRVMTNGIATLMARKAGFAHPFEITGTIHSVDHK
ncbi:MAG TPA: hypothetical protein VNU68_35170 [Verrucomicrobiae bacterium]|nr:hypothetical protein [Verrucomicrobiae bacterium]